MKRKIVSIVLTFALLLGLVTPVWSQEDAPKISQDDAMKIIKSNFSIPDNMKNVSFDYQEDSINDRKVWGITWDNSLFGKYRNIRAEVDAETGEILSYYYGEDFTNQSKSSKHKSKDECQKIAEAFLQKLIPQRFRETKLKIQPYPSYWDNGVGNYSFYYEREVNGIPFPENGINISINSATGELLNYNCSWDNTLTFPTVENTITPDQAEKVFREKVGLRLMYLSPYNGVPYRVANKKPVKLYYSVWDQFGIGGFIDATTGKVIDIFGKELTTSQKVYLEAKAEPAPGPKNQKELTVAEAKAKAISYVDKPSDYKIQSCSNGSGWGPGNAKTWQFQFEPNDYSQHKPLNVVIDAKTGELINLNSYETSPEGNKSLPINFNYEQCTRIASDFLEKVAPQKFDYVYLNPGSSQQNYYIVNNQKRALPYYSFSFIRVVNGIIFGTNSINIDVNNNTGEIVNYYSNWDLDQNFAAPANVINEQDAMNKLFTSNKMRIIYARKQSSDGKASGEIMTVYSFVDDNLVEAVSGKVTNYYQIESPELFDDIEGHWAKREINMLGSWGIVSGSNKKFNPDKPITRAEFVNMLVSVKGLEAEPNSRQTFSDVPKTAWYYNAVQSAVKAGFVSGSNKKFNPNSIITKQEMVVMLVKALNIKDFSDLPQELPAPYKDENKIAPWAKKYVAFAVQTGILSAENGYLKPTTPATRADAAVMIVRVIEKGSQSNEFIFGN